jgi:hypothetical protein
MIDAQAVELLQIAEQVRAGLIQMGLCYEIKKAGLTVAVSFRSLSLVDAGDGGLADFGLLEVDVQSLPRRVTVARLTKPSVLHQLSAVVGRPVYHLNTSGLTYCVDLRPQRARAARLPEMVALDAADKPGEIGPAYLALGVTRRGALWTHPERLKNVLIVGAQGTGKSVLLRLLAYQAIRRGWKLALADPDQATFNPDLWQGADCLIGGGVATSPGEVGQLFGLVLAEIERRADLFKGAPGYPDSLTEYNNLAGEMLPRLALVVDEANTYFNDRALAEQAADLARRARKWGLHVILAGHNWRAADISRGLSAMLQTRVAFHVSDDTSGRVVLERSGAQSLPAVPGRAIIRLEGDYRLVQTYYLDKAVLVDLVQNMPKSDNFEALDAAGLVTASGQGNDVTSKVTPTQLERIYELADLGQTPTAIATDIWQEKKNGRRVRLVKNILGRWDGGTE